ncbi:MAG: hypothetical protein Q9217_001056 [Psora testacea]
MTQQRISFKVHGTVQGVNFRSFAQTKAAALNITGWVKNTPDEKVAGEAQGSEDSLASYLKELNAGPRAAHVVKVDTEDLEVKDGESSFSALGYVSPPTSTLSPPGPAASTESIGSISPPLTRDSSPSPSISPTPALFPCPPLSRSFSANSSSNYSSSAASTISQPSATFRSTSASASLRQRGYVRPQGVTFAPSAGNRDSVLSLGSIAHLQYYFARTGLLDGKGAQLAKDNRGKPRTGRIVQDASPRIYIPSDAVLEGDMGTETILEDAHQTEEPMMLPPTVSTYSHRVQYIPPPPDSETLRQDLKSALHEAKKALQLVLAQANDSNGSFDASNDTSDSDQSSREVTASAFSQSSGWYEIQGLHILDVVTLAIRAAKMYYTSYEDPPRLYSIKSERQIREELLSVMDVLKRMAGRNFAGGIRSEELKVITKWLHGIEAFLAQEQALEKQEAEERASWQWLDGSWEGRERERERSFLNSFHRGEPLPEWTAIDPADPKPTPFLEALRTGLNLVYLHNTLLKKSKRQFGEIKTFHTDLAKPYRCAENLRYWMKAAEIRWETKLKVNVSGVVNGKEDSYADFDAAILQWSQAVRDELTKEWKDAMVKTSQPAGFRDLAEPEPSKT